MYRRVENDGDCVCVVIAHSVMAVQPTTINESMAVQPTTIRQMLANFCNRMGNAVVKEDAACTMKQMELCRQLVLSQPFSEAAGRRSGYVRSP
jgi:hypothetical protein